MVTVLAHLLAFWALSANGVPYADPFAEGAFTRAVVYQTEDFLGLEWQCNSESDERCYAGLSNYELIVGP